MCSAHRVCDLAFQPGEAAWIIITMAFHSLVPLAVILGHTVWSFSLFYLALTKHRGATGTGEAAEPLNCRPFQEMLTVSVADYTASLVSWITVVPIERVDDFILSFFFSAEDLSSSFSFDSHHVCVAFTLRCVREILDYSNHSNQCLLFNAEFSE